MYFIWTHEGCRWYICGNTGLSFNCSHLDGLVQERRNSIADAIESFLHWAIGLRFVYLTSRWFNGCLCSRDCQQSNQQNSKGVSLVVRRSSLPANVFGYDAIRKVQGWRGECCIRWCLHIPVLVASAESGATTDDQLTMVVESVEPSLTGSGGRLRSAERQVIFNPMKSAMLRWRHMKMPPPPPKLFNKRSKCR